MPFFSIITVNLNNANGLKKTIESVRSQTYQEYELLIIDGGSTDESKSLIKLFESTIAYWVSEKDNGIYDAMNKGIAQAKGEYILFLNSGDTFYVDDALEKVKTSSAMTDFIYGDLMLVKDNKEIRVKSYPTTLSHHYLLTDNVGHQAQFIRRKTFINYGNYNLAYKIVSDYEFFIRGVYKYKCTTHYLPFTISEYDLTGLSADPDQAKNIRRERKEIQKKYMPAFWVLIYHAYASFLETEIYKFPVVGFITKAFKAVFLKLTSK